MPKKHYYVTTPIYYVNGDPHIGSAYTTLAADVLARFKRFDGYDVKFLTGTDEHGLKVYQAARDRNMDPLSFCDEISQRFRDLIPLMKYTPDDFIRTTEARHKKGAQALWSKLVEKGDIYASKYAGWYAVRDEAYYDESEITTNAKGEKVATASGSPVAWMEEESYFFKLSAWQDKLIDFYTKNPDAIAPKARYNEVMSFLKGGLQDLSISRTTFDWGVPVPNDPKHVMYVWIDALTNYISALGYPEDTQDMQDYWPTAIHLVGKDILRFHAVYWPAFLMAADLTPPKRIFAHGWWTVEGQKMSKSLGNVIMPADLVNTYGLDQTRFFLLREVPFGNDGNFSRDAMVMRMNSELANDFGNLAQRVLMFIFKNNEAKLPMIGKLTEEDQALLESTGSRLIEACRRHIDAQEFHLMLEAIWNTIRAANVYVDQQAPWGLKKTDTARMETVLGVLCEVIRRVTIALQPVMPDATAKILDQLVVPQDKRNFEHLSDQFNLNQGAKIEQPQGVFPRFAAEAAA